MGTFVAKSPFVRGLALAVSVLGGGCGVLSKAPRIEIESLSLVRSGTGASEADLVVRISGGGPQATILTDFRYTVFVAGRRAYTGRWAALAAAPPEESLTRSLPVVIPDSMLGGASDEVGPVEIPWSVSGSVGWEDPDRFARILLDLGFATARAEFSGRGTAIERRDGRPRSAESSASRSGEADAGLEPIEAPLAP